MREIKFQTVADLTLETAYGILDQEKGVIMQVTIGIKDNETGWFECYDKATGGNDWYAEGGLWFEGEKIVDYDGVFELPHFIVKKLIQEGYKFEC